MKNIARTLKIALVAMMLTFAANIQLAAQPQQMKQQQPRMVPDSAQIVKMMDELATQLKLTPKQKATITKLHFEHLAQTKALMNKNKANHDKEKAERDTSKKKLDDAINAQLTDAQKAEFKKFRQSHQPPMREHKDNDRPQ